MSAHSRCSIERLSPYQPPCEAVASVTDHYCPEQAEKSGEGDQAVHVEDGYVGWERVSIEPAGIQGSSSAFSKALKNHFHSAAAGAVPLPRFSSVGLL